jgi:hypothetical protein
VPEARLLAARPPSGSRRTRTPCSRRTTPSISIRTSASPASRPCPGSARSR